MRPPRRVSLGSSQGRANTVAGSRLAKSVGLRNRRSQVRILPGALTEPLLTRRFRRSGSGATGQSGYQAGTNRESVPALPPLRAAGAERVRLPRIVDKPSTRSRSRRHHGVQPIDVLAHDRDDRTRIDVVRPISLARSAVVIQDIRLETRTLVVRVALPFWLRGRRRRMNGRLS